MLIPNEHLRESRTDEQLKEKQKTMPGTRLTEVTKRAICSDMAAKIPYEKIAKKYGVSKRTVCRLITSLKAAPIKPEVAMSVTEATIDRKASVVAKAYVAVQAGLDDPADSYKRAGI